MKRLLALACALLLSPAAGAAPQDVNWPHYGGQYDEAGYAALDQINRHNVKRLLTDKSAANPAFSLSLSPDGNYLTFANWVNKIDSEDENKNIQFGVASTENPPALKFFDVKLLSPGAKISPDGKALDYISWGEGKSMIMRQPIEGGEPTEIYALPKGRIFNFAWSKSGKQMAISQGQQYKDVVLLTDF